MIQINVCVPLCDFVHHILRSSLVNSGRKIQFKFSPSKPEKKNIDQRKPLKDLQ